MSDLKRNMQVQQPNIAELPEGNGWPDPLTDSGPQLRQQINDGKNGESIMNDGANTSQAKTGGWHLPEGDSSASGTQPNTSPDTPRAGRNDPTKTSQMLEGGHHTPEGN